MEVELAKPFIKAAVDVLSTMASITPQVGKPYVKKNNLAAGDVSGMVGITGEKNGSVSLSFSKGCAVALVKNMLGEEIEDIMQDVKDAVGELTNMISGQARAGLAEKGLVFQGSTPRSSWETDIRSPTWPNLLLWPSPSLHRMENSPSNSVLSSKLRPTFMRRR